MREVEVEVSPEGGSQPPLHKTAQLQHASDNASNNWLQEREREREREEEKNHKRMDAKVVGTDLTCTR